MLQCFTMHHKLELGCHLCGRESWHGGTPQIFAYVQIFVFVQIFVNICICANICKYLYLCKYLHIYACVWGKVDTVALPGGASVAAWGGGEPGHSLPQDLSFYLYSVFVFVYLYWKCHSICCCTSRQTFWPDQWSVIRCLPLCSKLSLFKRNHCLISTHTEYLCNVHKLRICHTWKEKAAPFCHFCSYTIWYRWFCHSRFGLSNCQLARC